MKRLLRAAIAKLHLPAVPQRSVADRQGVFVIPDISVPAGRLNWDFRHEPRAAGVSRLPQRADFHNAKGGYV
ncbi:MAG TPA: hypothetical protein VGM68_11600 [Rhizomicrobium sp.]|jgi:hypothetical protein